MKSNFKVLRVLYILGWVLAATCFIIAMVLTFVYIFNPSKEYYGSQSWEYHFVYNQGMLIAFILLYVFSVIFLIISACLSKPYKKARDEMDKQFVKEKVHELITKLNSIEHKIKVIGARADLLTEKEQIKQQIYYYKNQYLTELAQKRAKRTAVILATAAAVGATAGAAAKGFSDGYEKGRKMRK